MTIERTGMRKQNHRTKEKIKVGFRKKFSPFLKGNLDLL
jgi:putative transposon-encoded protein